ncbi:hypothetical protein BKA70DRAFT_175837 [Coprinopsis sp. MPI-PUGE-AT-0042]|nr:hypothetical protein BKA70DRAFT_175837 [Coprinopsis sp. MPI-PUGE-AT-0042]
MNLIRISGLRHMIRFRTILYTRLAESGWMDEMNDKAEGQAQVMEVPTVQAIFEELKDDAHGSLPPAVKDEITAVMEVIWAKYLPDTSILVSPNPFASTGMLHGRSHFPSGSFIPEHTISGPCFLSVIDVNKSSSIRRQAPPPQTH